MTGDDLEEVAHAAVRGTIGAMAMTGMRSMTVALGLIEQTPPEAIMKQRARGLLRRVPRGGRRAVIEFVHWSYGAAAGAAFGALPDGLRRRPFVGPAYGLGCWLGFELGLAPILGLSQSKRPRPVERLALAADHVLYGFVLAETRSRPRE
jgi:hypothetical protein